MSQAKVPTDEELEWMKENLNYNPWSGLIWNKKRYQPSSPPGTSKTYTRVRVMESNWLAHRVIWYLQTGTWPDLDMVIDHINGMRNDNRWVNLRLATTAQNNANKHMPSPLSKIMNAFDNTGVAYTHKDNNACSTFLVEGVMTMIFTLDGQYIGVKEGEIR